MTAALDVEPGPATHLVVSGLADPSSAAAAQSLTVTAKGCARQHCDRLHRHRALHVHRRRRDAPGDYTFTAADAGFHTFASGVTLGTPGSQTVTATDTATASIAGSQTVNVEPGEATHLVVTGLADPSAPGAGRAWS